MEMCTGCDEMKENVVDGFCQRCRDITRITPHATFVMVRDGMENAFLRSLCYGAIIVHKHKPGTCNDPIIVRIGASHSVSDAQSVAKRFLDRVGWTRTIVKTQWTNLEDAKRACVIYAASIKKGVR